MEQAPHKAIKPNLKPRLFWEFRYDDIDWQASARSVIERVLTWGNDEEYEELIRFYGRERIVHALTKEHVMLPNYEIDHVKEYFGLKKEDLYCYRRRQVRHYNWI
jgi:hypothetical protein